MFSKKLRQSIGFKFLIIVSAILFTSTVVISSIIAINEREMLRHSLITKGKGLASYLAKLSKDPLILKDIIELDTIVNQTIKDEEVLYAVIQDTSGNPLTSQYASIDYYWPRVKEIVSGLPKESRLEDIIAVIKRQGGVTEVSTPIAFDTDAIGKVILGLSEHKVQQQVVKTILFIVVLNLVVMFVLGFVLFIVSKKLIIDPITKLAQATTRIAKGELATRVEVKTTGEVQVLVESFNLMMEDLGKAIISKENELTERKRAEEGLRESEKKYKEMVDFLPISIFEIDMQSNIVSFNNTSLDIFGYKKEDYQEGLKAHQFFEPNEWERLGENIQKVIKGTSIPGQEFTFLRKDGRTFPGLIYASLIFWGNEPVGIRGAIIDITSRKLAEEAIRQTMEKLRKALGGIIQATASMVETKDPYTAGHQRRVADLARAIGQDMGLPEDQVDGLRTAGVIHDLGKIAVPAEILSKPTQLSKIEWELIKVHSQTGYDILKDIEFPWPVARMVLEHHERINGSGYPIGLRGEEILLETRILMVADVVEAIASHRPYRPAHGIDMALEEISQNKGILFDPEVVDVCLRLFKEKGFKLE